MNIEFFDVPSIYYALQILHSHFKRVILPLTSFRSASSHFRCNGFSSPFFMFSILFFQILSFHFFFPKLLSSKVSYPSVPSLRAFHRFIIGDEYAKNHEERGLIGNVVTIHFLNVNGKATRVSTAMLCGLEDNKTVILLC